MAKQERAVRTRQAILEAAASIFDERGYESASIAEILARGALTKGALYFHFTSKEDLARGVVAAQGEVLQVVEGDSPLQSLIDTSLWIADRLQTDVVLRAGIRLTVEGGVFDLPGAAPCQAWIEAYERLLAAALSEGELLPHVDPEGTAELLVGSFIGTQVLDRARGGRRDLSARVTAMWQHLLPGIAVCGMLPRLRTEAPGGTPSPFRDRSGRRPAAGPRNGEVPSAAGQR
ncbi:ScbR family autoregulator-binding transcription factor [Streptomyces thermolineatus]|uniref:ScbR family autoregulator-binding transcription factor n=1 Tax=Streptomyces thermolineatus TaxID=44033 RepID=A0ABP5ZXE8_9ACTN